MIWILIIVVIVILDQVSKYLILNNVNIDNSMTVINNFLYFTRVKNNGTAFGLFQNSNYIFIPLIFVIMIVICYFFFKQKNLIIRTAFSIVLGGAMGNQIDRIFRGSVVDFIDFKFGSYHFYVFNIADSFVCIGTILLAFYLLFIYKENEEKKLTSTDN